MFGNTSALALTEVLPPEESAAEVTLPAEETPAPVPTPTDNETANEPSVTPDPTDTKTSEPIEPQALQDSPAEPRALQNSPADARALQGAPAQPKATTRQIAGRILSAKPLPALSTGTYSYSVWIQNQVECYPNCPPSRDGALPSTASKGLSFNPKTGVFKVSGLQPGIYSVALGYQLGVVYYPILYMMKVDVRTASQTGITANADGAASGTLALSHKIKKDWTGRPSISLLDSKNREALTFLQGCGKLPCYLTTKPGTYKVKVTLPNGRVLYLSTADKSGATDKAALASKFTLRAYQETAVKADFRTWEKQAPAFTDVKPGAPFYADIRWLVDTGLTTGVAQSNGTYKFLPKQNVTRETVAESLYAASGVKNYTPTYVSPFADVYPDHPLYKAIMWAHEKKLLTGVKQSDGTLNFNAQGAVTREEIAVAMYRQYSSKIPAGTKAQKLTDVPANHKFAKEINWMVSNKITTGVKQSNGTIKFLPKSKVNRESLAAFLHRAELLKK